MEKILLNKVVLFCTVCNTEFTIDRDEAIWYGTSQECEMCGDHGQIELYATCSNCDFYSVINVYSW
jgi:hypothetical protein